jgi:hypothetical protein
MAIQPASERVSSVFQRYEEDAAQYRGGMGTYLPIPVSALHGFTVSSLFAAG